MQRRPSHPLAQTAVTRRRAPSAVAALCLVQFVDVLGVTVVVTALPAMLADLHAGAGDGGLIATAYAMCFGGLLMLGARLGDRYGHRRVIIAGLAVFVLASAVAASAGAIAVLVLARCLQGAAAAMSVPCALRLLTAVTADGEPRRRAIALWSAAGAAAGASGFVLGGVVTQAAGWRVVFWAFVPLGVALIAAVVVSVPAPPAHRRHVRLSLPSCVTFIAATMLFVLATTLLPERHRAAVGAVALLAAAGIGGLFVIVDGRASAPLLSRLHLSQPTLRRGTVGAFLNTATTSSAITLMTLYLQDARGRSPLTAALLLLPFSLAVIVGATGAAPALAAYGRERVLAAGLAVIALSDAALIPSAGPIWPVAPAVAVGGAGIGLASVAANALATDVEVELRATAAGVVNTAAQLGTAVGVALIILAAQLTTGAPGRGVGAPAPAWAGAAALGVAGSAAFIAAARRAERQRRQRASSPA